MKELYDKMKQNDRVEYLGRLNLIRTDYSSILNIGCFFMILTFILGFSSKFISAFASFIFAFIFLLTADSKVKKNKKELDNEFFELKQRQRK